MSKNRSTASPAPADAPVDAREFDEQLHALSRVERRRVLAALLDAEESVPVDTDWGDPARLTDSEVMLSFHLDRLDRTGYVEYDRAQGTVRHGPRFEAIAPLVAALVGGDRNGNGEPPFRP